jgi:hypothetical protein
MSPQTLYRLSGASLFLGGLMGTIALLVHPGTPTVDTLNDYVRVSQPIHILLFFGIVLIILGLPGVYVRQSGKTKVLGLISMLLLVFGDVLVDLPHTSIEFAAFPALAANAAPKEAFALANDVYQSTLWGIISNAALLLVVISVPFFTIVSLRARVLPRWPAFVLLAFEVLTFASFLPFLPDVIAEHSPALFYLGLASYGFVLLIEKRTAAAPASVPAQAATASGAR